jgi:RND superfamily putative drug exporter
MPSLPRSRPSGESADTTTPLGRFLRRAKWPVVVGWILLAVALGSFADSLPSVEKSDEMSFLPRTSQSTEASRLLRHAPGGDALDAVIVYRRARGLTKQDRQRIKHDRSELTALHLEGARPASQERFSPDSTTALYSVPIARSAGGNAIEDAVRKMRDHLPETRGLQVKVTGEAGLQLDHAEVFSGVGTTLLYVTIAIVAVLLLLTYRSPVLWLLPLLTVGLGLRVAQAAVYGYGRSGGTVSDLSAGILTVLAFGAGTDYALLLVSRYREELRQHRDRHEALARALSRSVGAITASAGTVIAAMLCLLIAELNSNRGLGPVAAIGVALVYLVTMTLLPALLAVCGRWLFWPLVPRAGQSVTNQGVWASVARSVARQPRKVWACTAGALIIMSFAVLGISTGLNPLNEFPSSADAAVGQKLISQSFPAGASAPASVIVPSEQAAQARRAVEQVPGVQGITGVVQFGSRSELVTVLKDGPYEAQAMDTVRDLRSTLDHSVGQQALVGGPTATQVDTRAAASRDDAIIAPLVLGVILLILMLLLRSVVGPVLLIATVVLSFAAAFGISSLLFQHVLGFAGINPSIPLYVFVFLVALGVDYNIFLMHRVREESATHGTRTGMMRALEGTGPVITSAGVVLAGTFAALAILPFVPLAEVGFAVAFGVLLDTLVVRTLLVPALVLDIGEVTWWPRHPDPASLHPIPTSHRTSAST